MQHLFLHSASPTRVLLATIGGVVSILIGKVKLFIDTDTEESYIETEPGFEMEALRAIEFKAQRLGYEVIGEWEAPPEEFSDGRVRHWLAQTWFPADEEIELPASEREVA